MQETMVIQIVILAGTEGNRWGGVQIFVLAIHKLHKGPLCRELIARESDSE